MNTTIIVIGLSLEDFRKHIDNIVDMGNGIQAMGSIDNFEVELYHAEDDCTYHGAEALSKIIEMRKIEKDAETSPAVGE